MTLDSVIADMYASICFEAGGRPDWNRQAEIFAPDARMVRITDDGIFEFDLQSYRANLEALIDSGAMPSFFEAELWRETHRFGELAHVLKLLWRREGRELRIPDRPPSAVPSG